MLQEKSLFWFLKNTKKHRPGRGVSNCFQPCRFASFVLGWVDDARLLPSAPAPGARDRWVSHSGLGGPALAMLRKPELDARMSTLCPSAARTRATCEWLAPLGQVKGRDLSPTRRALRPEAAQTGGADRAELGGGSLQWGVRDPGARPRNAEPASNMPGLASRAHQGCGSLPEPSAFIIATVNQRFQTVRTRLGEPRRPVSPPERSWGTWGKGEESLPGVGRSAEREAERRASYSRATSPPPASGLRSRSSHPSRSRVGS